ncbi:MAG: ABC transporter permease [Mariprofundaceae bacterium]|nr:ABC transporter permease [Mariprofundaceae bacterium]
MNIVRLLCYKDFKMLARDRSTMITLILFPLMMGPLGLGFEYLMVHLVQHQAKKEIHIGVVGLNHAPTLYYLLRSDTQLILHTDINEADIQRQINDKSIQVALVIPETFTTDTQQMKTSTIQLYFKTKGGTGDLPIRHIKQLLTLFKGMQNTQRLGALQLTEAQLSAVKIEQQDLASKEERSGKMAGMFLPMLLFFNCLFICMAVALEMGVGEKEKKTLETLLSLPIQRIKLLGAKFIVLFSVALWAPCATLATIVLVFMFPPDFIPAHIIQFSEPLLRPQVIIIMVLLMLPIAAFFALLMLLISLWSKTIAQGSAYMSLLTVSIMSMMLIPVIFSIDLNGFTAMIPVLNVLIACREVTAGTITALPLVIVLLSSLALIAATITIASKIMLKEHIIFAP